MARTAPSERLCRRSYQHQDGIRGRRPRLAHPARCQKSAGDRRYQDRGAVVLESPTPPSLCLYYVFFIFFLFFIFYVYFAFLPTRGR